MRPVPYLSVSCIVSLCYSLQASHHVNGEIESITSEQLNEGIRNQLYAAVIDVRSQTDWDLGHIPNATHIASLNTMDLPPIPQAITGSCNAEDQKIVVTCRTGFRAAIAADKLFAAGYKATIYNGGGTDNWIAAGFELVQTESRESCTAPTDDPTPAPSTAVTATPTKKPVATCFDSRTYRFKGKKNRSCIWISKKAKRTKNLCKKKGVKKNCKIVCGKCCADDLTRKFTIGKKPDQQKKSCNYLSFKQRKYDLCPKKGVNAICAKMCGRCCSNVKNFEVDTPQGPKKCSWIAAIADRKNEYCQIPANSEGCSRVCDSCTDYTIPKTDSPSKSPVITPAPVSVPVKDVTRAPVKMDDD